MPRGNQRYFAPIPGTVPDSPEITYLLVKNQMGGEQLIDSVNYGYNRKNSYSRPPKDPLSATEIWVCKYAKIAKTHAACTGKIHVVKNKKKKELYGVYQCKGIHTCTTSYKYFVEKDIHRELRDLAVARGTLFLSITGLIDGVLGQRLQRGEHLNFWKRLS